MKKEKLKVTDSCGNVFLDLGFSPEEATILAMRSQRTQAGVIFHYELH